MKITQSEIDENKVNAVDLLLKNSDANAMWADRCLTGIEEDADKITEWNESKHIQIYWLLDSNGKPFYVGQSTNVKHRVRSHRCVVGTNDYTNKEFTYEIIDEVFAPKLYSMKLEFMYIVNCILLHGIDNSFNRKYAGWCFYYTDDFELFHGSVANKMTFQEYQFKSLLHHVRRTGWGDRYSLL